MVAGAFLTNVRLIVEDGLFEMGELLEEMKFLIAIGRISEIDLGLAFYEDALLMAEGLKAGRAMIGAHAAAADPAKGEVVVGEMHDGVVHAATAKGGNRHHVLGLFAILREIVEG